MPSGITDPLVGRETGGGGARALPPPRPRSRRPLAARQEYRTAALFLGPPLLLFLLFKIVPDAYNFYYAFTDWASFKDSINFVGLDSFRFLIQEGALTQAIKVTLIFAVCSTVVQQVLALALAVALERGSRFNVALRGVFFLPVLFSGLAAGYIFLGVLAPDGPLNAALSALTRRGVSFPWLADVSATLYVTACIQAWKGFPFTMMVFIAGLTAVPQVLVEAAQVEGASAWEVLRYVKIPLLAPAFTFGIVTTIIGGLQSADIILATTNGGPGDATQVLGIYTFQKFGSGYFGQATAGSLVLFLCVSALAIPLVIALRRREVAL